MDATSDASPLDDDRVAAGIEHLQAAATEMISAARALLDVAEDVVRDPDRLASLVETFGDLARGAGRAMAHDAGSSRPAAPGVEHIRVG